MFKGQMSPVFFSIVALLAVGCGAANIQPNRYTLELLIDTDNDIFTGDLVIDAKVLVPGATNFVLHNNGLNISTVSVTQSGGNLYQTMTSNDAEQYVTVSTTQGLTGDLIRIVISYQGRVSADQTGLFSFRDSGKKFYMTNFYPIYARKVFPCVDEPGTAAPIALTIVVTKNDGVVVGSTPIVQETTLSNGYKKYELNVTTSITPYSLFFAIGDWDSSAYLLPKPTTVWLTPTVKAQLGNIDPNLITAITEPNLNFFLTGFVQNLNILVTPSYQEQTYSGLNSIVLRRDVVLENAQETTKEMKRDQLLKISYALWKMFFGTVTRPANWGNNWLASSVPIYLAYKTLDVPGVQAEYGTSDENLISGLYEKVFDTSSTNDSPVTYTTITPTTPKAILSFVRDSGIEKGVYALKTIESVVDPATLPAAIYAYLVQQNGTTMDTPGFIDFIDKATHPTINSNKLSDVMMPILTQSGYPLVAVSRNQGTLDILKSSFAMLNSQPAKFAGQVSQLADASVWQLPVTVITSLNGGANASVMFFQGGSNNMVEIGTGFNESSWALINVNGKGMMRTSYDPQTWKLFSTQATSFSQATRAKLVEDAFATAESQVQSWTSTLKFLDALDSETELAPWKAALAGFKRMWSWIYGSGSSTNTTKTINLVEPFQKYVTLRLTNIYDKLGPVGSNTDPKDELRRDIVGAMCEYGNTTCVQNLTAQYNMWMLNQGAAPSNDLLSVVVCNGLRNANLANWKKAFNNYVYSGAWYSQPLNNSHYNFLACTEDKDAIESYLTSVLMNVSGVTFPQDQILPAISQILDHPQHVDQVLKFWINNQPKFNLSSGLQAEIMTEIGERLTLTDQTTLLSQFLKNVNVTADIRTAITNAVNAGNAKAAYILNIQSDVQKGLNGDEPVTVSPPTNPTPSPATGGSPATPTAVPTPPSTTPDAASAATVSFIALLATLGFVVLVQ